VPKAVRDERDEGRVKTQQIECWRAFEGHIENVAQLLRLKLPDHALWLSIERPAQPPCLTATCENSIDIRDDGRDLIGRKKSGNQPGTVATPDINVRSRKRSVVIPSPSARFTERISQTAPGQYRLLQAPVGGKPSSRTTPRSRAPRGARRVPRRALEPADPMACLSSTSERVDEGLKRAAQYG